MNEKNFSKANSYDAYGHNANLDLMVPDEMFIKLLIYRGSKRDEIIKVVKDLYLYPLAASDIDNIKIKCRSTEDGQKMIDANQTKLTGGESLYISEKVRQEFKYPEVFDSMMKLLKDNDVIHCFSNRQLVTNLNKRRFLECSILFGLSFPRFKQGWKVKFEEKINETEYDLFKYYFWDIGNYDQNKCDALIDKHPEYPFYNDFKSVNGFSQVNLLSYFSIASEDEILNHERNLFEDEMTHREEQSDISSNSYSVKKDSQYIRRKNHYNKLLVHLEKAEFWLKELERIFARITGKTRYNIMKDNLKNIRRINRVPELDEEYIFHRK